ncbi:PTS IIA-like nitrogen regulatory protein PtsN [Marinomonas fungiae]|uniref:PTS IIA-like nitrogen-regulatory protein PtsN n=1 Tax=Marinomonas fungiae TaxID=1137284 RepID=A0A0K6IJG4_9GAMM|nr:PTS IIA-like nitrogen regulatory protein PtsN [Marinomonas fungiae]CUB03245.1 PTS IIA-like nitrogen-regulatory protein PtsN [Marinomonas fungiae]
MSVKNLVKPELVFAKQQISSKKRLLEQLAESVGDRLHCNADEVYDALLGREKLGSTGIGNGIAIPHCRLDQANRATIVLMSLETPIDFDSIDRRPVDLIFALLVPSNQCDEHLATLAQIAELAQSEDKLNILRQAQSNSDLYSAFDSLI